MNRHQRRASEKRSAPPAPTAPQLPAAAPSKPGLGLRLISWFLLSGWMMRRVRHPQVLVMLRGLAREANREKAYRELSERLNLPH